MICYAKLRTGITLLEVLLVVGILAVLIGLLLPAIQKVRETANLLRSKNNLRQIALASQSYAAVSKDCLPDACVAQRQNTLYDQLMPYLDANVFSDVSGMEPDHPHYFLGRQHKLLLSPGDPTLSWIGDTSGFLFRSPFFRPAGLCSYSYNRAVVGINSQFGPVTIYNPQCRYKDISDGLSNTILFSEKYSRCDTYTFQWDRIGSSSPFLSPPEFPLYRIESTGKPRVSSVPVGYFNQKRPTFQFKPCTTSDQSSSLTRTATPTAAAGRCAMGIWPRPISRPGVRWHWRTAACGRSARVSTTTCTGVRSHQIVVRC